MRRGGQNQTTHSLEAGGVSDLHRGSQIELYELKWKKKLVSRKTASHNDIIHESPPTPFGKRRVVRSSG